MLMCFSNLKVLRFLHILQNVFKTVEMWYTKKFGFFLFFPVEQLFMVGLGYAWFFGFCFGFLLGFFDLVPECRDPVYLK